MGKPCVREDLVNTSDSMIRMNDLRGRYAGSAQDIEASVMRVLQSGHYVGGPFVKQAETAVAQHFNRAFAVGVNSGTDALVLSLQALGVQPEDEVILPALTFFATAGAVCSIGAIPKLVDVREDGCIDPELVLSAITSKTRAVIPVHLYGTRAELPAMDIPIVDDAAQAIGGSPPRSMGALTAISTYPTKTWGGIGDGGFVTGDNPILEQHIRQLANHGITQTPQTYERVMGHIGRNSRLDAIQAAALTAQLPRLNDRIVRRRAISSRYDQEIHSAARPLPRDPGSPVHQYPVRVQHRDYIRSRMAEENIETAVYYRKALSQQPALGSTESAPIAEQLAAEILCLPVHSGLSDHQVTRILTTLERVLNE